MNFEIKALDHAVGIIFSEFLNIDLVNLYTKTFAIISKCIFRVWIVRKIPSRKREREREREREGEREQERER